MVWYISADAWATSIPLHDISEYTEALRLDHNPNNNPREGKRNMKELTDI